LSSHPVGDESLDRTGPTLTSSLSAPSNGTFYDVEPSLVTQIQNVIKAPSNPAPKLRGFISVVQGATTSQITAAYTTLLLNWANDLLARL